MLGSQTRDNLWTLILPPTVWAVHFLVSYVVAAIHCAKAPDIFAPLPGVRITIGAATAVAVALIAFAGVRAWREWRGSGIARPFDQATAAHRERQLEFATVLLAGLSLVGVLFVALPAWYYGDCR